ncbi:MAG: protease modulator HflC, partial [Succinivibrio sp.]|nr:protease modulator HflC [Succinivibrio sp.]
QNALKDIGASAKALGIKIVDVRIKQINLPPEVSNSIYQRMRAERDAVAKLHRSQGRKEAEAIKAHADREVVVKIAEAERQARTLRGEGDAEATRIYAQAYKQNPQLFEFLRSMDAYKKSMASGKDVLVLKPDSEFFKYFNDANGAKGTN